MLPDIRVTYTRIVQGVIGTMLAVLTVWLLDLADAPQAVLLAAILVFAFVLPSQLPRFWLFSGLIAAIVLMAWALASGDPTLEPLLLWERLEDTFIAAGLVACGRAVLPVGKLVCSRRPVRQGPGCEPLTSKEEPMRMLILVAAMLMAFGCLASSARRRMRASTEAVAYCKAAGNIDAPDKAYTGPAVPGWMIPALLHAARDQGADGGGC